MDTQSALLFLVILAAILVTGILFFLFRALKVLDKIEASTKELETVTVPLMKSLQRMAEEVEPVVNRTTQHYRTIEEGLGALSRNPVLSLFSPFLRAGGGPIHVASSLIRVARGVAAGIHRAREVLKRSEHPTPELPSKTTQEESHGQ